MTVTTCDVCIIGGGPGGLATALALMRAMPDITVKVYERARAYRPMGAGIGIDINGLKAIEAIDPALEQQLSAHGYATTKSVTYDHLGKELRSDNIDLEANFKKYGKRGCLLGWFEVQQAFYRALPPSTVTFGSRFESYEEDAEGVTVHFQGGTPGPVRARVLIGADGFFSSVRQQCLADGPPDFGGTVVWRARVPLTKPLDHLAWYFGADKVCFQYPISKDCMVWTFSAPVRLVEEAGVDFDPANGGRLRASTQAVEGTNVNALERCLRVFKGYPAACLDRIRGTDPGTVTEHGIFTRPAGALPAEGWGRGCVTLVGDAAHPVRPTGQGLNMTFEDAAELAWHLQQGGLGAEALRAFEKERIPRVGIIVQKAEEQGKAAYKKDAQAATVTNQRFNLSEDYTHFRCSKDFRPLAPDQAAHASTSAAQANGAFKEPEAGAAHAPGAEDAADGPKGAAAQGHAAGSVGSRHQRKAVVVAAAGLLAAGLVMVVGAGRA